MNTAFRSFRRGLRCALALATLVAGFDTGAHAQTVTSVTPGGATVGTTLLVEGSGFGTRRVSAYLARAGTRKRLRLSTASLTDTETRLLVRSFSGRRETVAGTWDLHLRASGANTVVVPGAVELRLPDELALDRDSVGRNELVTLTGTFLGSGKGQILVAGMLTQGVEWNASDEGPGQVTFRIPDNAPGGLVDVEVKNPVGRVVMRDAITIEDTGSGGGGTTTAPPLQVVSAGATSNTEILVQFNQQVLGGIGDAESPAHYRITTDGDPAKGIPASTLFVLDATLIGDHSTVRLTTLSQSDLRYKVTVTSVRDVFGRPILAPTILVDPSSATFTGMAPNALDLVDTDGDGLSDAVEQRGWTIAIRRTNGDVIVRSVTSDPGDPREAADSERNLAALDTDADGMPDAEELHYGIDPRNPDSDGDTLSDFRELNWIYADPTNQDSDADTLDDGLEFGFFKTTPIMADTDGDQLSDPEELLVRNRDPRSSDLPRHAIRIGDVFVQLNVDYSIQSTSGSTTSVHKDASVTLQQNSSSEVTNTDTVTTEWFAKAGVSGNSGASFPDGLSAGIEFTAEAGVGGSGTYVQTSESKQASAAVRADTETSGVDLVSGETETRTVTGARLVVPVTIENISDVAFTMSGVEITALIPNPADPTSLIPIATLLPEDGTSTSWNFGTIDAQRGPFRFVSNESSINPDLVDALLAEPKSIIFRVSNFNLVDEIGRSFAFQQQDVTERTAPVVIDYGNGSVERHWVALGGGRITPFADGGDADNNGDGDIDELDRIVFDPSGKPVGVDLVQALEEVVGLAGVDLDAGPDVTDPQQVQQSFAYRVLELDPAEGGDPVEVRSVVRIRDVQADQDSYEAWALLTSDGYDALKNFDEVVLRRSEGVTFALVVDRDHDGVTRRIETLYGTSDEPGNVDTDGDGRGDFEEIYESWVVQVTGELPRDVYSNGAEADQDADGLDDSEEEDLGTDPRRADTDGDGTCDGPGIVGCTEDLFPLDAERSGEPPLLAEYLFSTPPDTASVVQNSSLSGDSLDATVIESVCVIPSTDRRGVTHGAYTFNDSGLNASCQGGADVLGEIRAPHLAIGSTYSLSAWVYISSMGDGWIVGQGGSTSSNGWARLQLGQTSQFFTGVGFSSIGTSGRINFVIPGASVSSSVVVTDSHAPALNTWMLFNVLVVDNIGTTTVTLWRDLGVAASVTVPGSFPNPSSTAPFFIGGMRLGPNNNFVGAIDDVRVYDGLLSISNINELYLE